MNDLNIQNLFDAPTKETYWHHIMKKYSGATFYTSEKNKGNIDKKIEELGKEALGKIDEVSGLTPLHVASIVGNRAGLQFLLRQKVSRITLDRNNRTAEEYAKTLHPELMIDFSFPFSEDPQVREILKPIFEKYRVKLPEGSFTYHQYTDDFGREINKLILSDMVEVDFDTTNQMKLASIKWMIRNIQDNIAPRLGILTEKTQGSFPVRDHVISHPTQGHFLRERITKKHAEVNEKKVLDVKSAFKDAPITKAIARAHSYTNYFSENAFSNVWSSFLNARMGRAHLDAMTILQSEPRIFPKGHDKMLISHLEGGNIFNMTNLDGKIVSLISKEHLISTLNLLRLEGYKSEYPKLMLSTEKMCRIAEEMYSQGILLQNAGSGFLSSAQILAIDQQEKAKKKENNKTVHEKALELGFIKPFGWNSEIETQVSEAIFRYINDKKAAKGFQSRDVGIDLKNISYIPPLHYHLDTFLKPGPRGSVFVADFAMTAELLETILKEQDKLGLTEEDRLHAENYLSAARKFDQKLGGLLKKIHKKISKVNLLPIPTPGFLFYGDMETTYHLNFMNALSGWSSAANNYYFITTGAQVGNRLGKVLMGMFYAFLDEYQPGIDLFYVSRNPQNPEDFSQVMPLWNLKGAQYGPHCFSFELETKDHQEKE